MAQILICDYCKEQVSEVTQVIINEDSFDFCQNCLESLMSQLAGNPTAPTAKKRAPTKAAAPTDDGDSLLCDPDPPKPAKKKPGRPKGSGKKKTKKAAPKKEISTEDPVTNKIDLSGDDATVRRNLLRMAKDDPNFYNNLVKFEADIGTSDVQRKMLKRFKEHRKKLQRQFNKSEGNSGVKVNIEKD